MPQRHKPQMNARVHTKPCCSFPLAPRRSLSPATLRPSPRDDRNERIELKRERRCYATFARAHKVHMYLIAQLDHLLRGGLRLRRDAIMASSSRFRTPHFSYNTVNAFLTD